MFHFRAGLSSLRWPTGRALHGLSAILKPGEETNSHSSVYEAGYRLSFKLRTATLLVLNRLSVFQLLTAPSCSAFN